ncbi:hypothetical protein MGALJ_19650 [Mycobacterium gallinarum]|uniref:Uncharacterized protein n=1 Tax=Mycobacterium gallinarum TaxID=39689 RepID=A0A9W4B1D3_9MYCO|nr:hypothetical protein [Mycobacterium gallinarum]BBY92296.1 hypothetical protein MGALJ_19650 [Mycobacterium gallinarum]
MTKILNTFASIERYDLEYDRAIHGRVPVVPKHFDVIHAGVFPDPEDGFAWMKIHDVILDAKEPVFADSRLDAQPSACGKRVKTFLPKPFDDEHPKACPDCVRALGDLGPPK